MNTIATTILISILLYMQYKLNENDQKQKR